MINSFTDRLKRLWSSVTRKADEEQLPGIDREKIIVFTICILLAFCLWMIVNLNRDYHINIKVPLSLGNITTNKALTNELPKNATASVTGKGWDLINTYNDPPHVYIDVSSDEVNLFEQVRQQISNASNISVQKVKPLYLQIELEDKKSKKVPVRPVVSLHLAQQYATLGDPVLMPDSVVIRGAASHIAMLNAWPTDSLSFKNVKNSFTQKINLKEPTSLVTLSETSVNYHVDVAQFTEGEVVIPVEPRDFPVGEVVNFSPSAVHVKYRIPLKEYSTFSKGHPFAAYVTYAQIQQDTTGFIVPKIEKLPKRAHLKVKAVQPQEVAYFSIIGN